MPVAYPQRIGLLTYGLDRPLSGVTRVASELGSALEASADVDVRFLTPYRHGLFRDAPGRSTYLPLVGRVPGMMALGGPIVALTARRLGLDLVHDPIGISPFTLGRWAGRFKRVVTLHDAIAFRFPQGYSWLNNLLHRRYVPPTLRNVDAVITDSEHAKSDLQHFLGLPASRIHVVPLGVSNRFRPVPEDVAATVTARYGLDGPFVLSVGARQARKNLPRQLAAFAQLRARHPELRLALAGPTLWRYDALERTIAELGLGDSVRLLGYVSDDDLPALYGAASLFVFPSLYEGFGLPVLEAMACGTPVLCSNTTSLPEVASEAAMLVDPYDVNAMAESMDRALTDRELHEELRTRGLARAAELTWERTARETVRVYQQVLAGSC